MRPGHGAGKRRTAREMAVRMLYQVDLGGSPLPQVFHAFDLAEFWARPAKKRTRNAAEAPRKPSSTPASWCAAPWNAGPRSTS